MRVVYLSGAYWTFSQINLLNSTAQSEARTLQGYEAMNMISKGQVKGAEKQQIADQNHFISKIFGLAA